MDSSKNNKDELADSKEEQLIESNESKITKAEKRKNYIKEYNSRYYQENANKILEKRKEKRQMKVKTDIATSNTSGKNPNDSCSDDDFEEKHLKKLDDARLYKKQWYEKNAQRIKQERRNYKSNVSSIRSSHSSKLARDIQSVPEVIERKSQESVPKVTIFICSARIPVRLWQCLSYSRNFPAQLLSHV